MVDSFACNVQFKVGKEGNLTPHKNKYKPNINFVKEYQFQYQIKKKNASVM